MMERGNTQVVDPGVRSGKPAVYLSQRVGWQAVRAFRMLQTQQNTVEQIRDLINIGRKDPAVSRSEEVRVQAEFIELALDYYLAARAMMTPQGLSLTDDYPVAVLAAEKERTMFPEWFQRR